MVPGSHRSPITACIARCRPWTLKVRSRRLVSRMRTSNGARGALWGIPIVTKANTAVKGPARHGRLGGICDSRPCLHRAERCNRGGSPARVRRGHPGHHEHAGLRGERHQSLHCFRAHGQCLRCALFSRRLFRRHGHFRHPRTRRCWARAPIRETASAWSPGQAPSSACFRRAAWCRSPASRRSTGCWTTPARSRGM